MRFYNINKLLTISILTSLSLTIVSLNVKAQIFGGEQNPLSVKWRQINASGFKLIYPVELEAEAQRMANTITTIFPFDGASLGVSKTTLPIVLQNRGVVANGFVQLAPKKSEFLTTPPQQFDSQDWLNNLAVHELRHAAQFDKLTRGQAYPFPEEIYFAFMGASIPLWFFEGDAVSTETSLTKAGRGRQPSWIMPYRTTLLNNKNISYSKANFGSSKDVTPGYYQLGYLMASNIRKDFGKQIFDSLLTDIRNRPFRLYPFSNSLKKYTGKGSKQWYLETVRNIKSAWQVQDQNNPSVDYPSLNEKPNFATDYFLPVRLPTGTILTLKQSKAQTPRFVTIDSNKNEKQIVAIGFQEQPWFSYNNGKIVWDEIRYDPRFRQRSYSVICVYNFETKKIKKLSSKSRIFAPSLSPDGKKIVAVQIDLANQVNLIEMNSETGKILYTFPNPKNSILQTPSYNFDGSVVTFVNLTEKGKSIWTIKKNVPATLILPETRQQISRPIFINENIAFNAHYSGVDNIYSIDINSKEIVALSASKYGAFNPTYTKKDSQLLFNNYNLRGQEIASTQLNASKVDSNRFVYFGATAEQQENVSDVFAEIPDSTYQSKPYKKLGHLINFHSISPVIENDYVGGLAFKSDNLLNTFSVSTGVNYHRDLKRFEYNAGVSFKSLFPILTANYKNRPARTFYSTKQGIKQGDWRENNIQLNALVPVNLNALNKNYGASFRVGTSYTKRYMAENLPSNFITELKLPMNYGFTFSHTVREAERDIAPRWGQILRFTYIHQPFDKKLQGELFAAEGFLYVPGLAKNHSFLINFNYQQATGVRRYNTEINTVYGYNNIAAISKLNNTLLFNYRFPFAFPDAEIGPLAYIRNLRAGVFCHYENIGTETSLKEPKTYGFEIHSNMNLLRYEPIFDIGTRFVFVNKMYNHNPILELIVNYSF
jgi:hypothetical protein